MAEPKSEVNKGQAARAILTKNPQASIKEVVSTLAAQGIEISYNYVYMLKSKAKDKRRKAKREKALATSNNVGITNPVELIRDVKSLAARAGGLRNLKQLVDILCE